MCLFLNGRAFCWPSKMYLASLAVDPSLGKEEMATVKDGKCAPSCLFATTPAN